MPDSTMKRSCVVVSISVGRKKVQEIRKERSVNDFDILAVLKGRTASPRRLPMSS